jgi:hypothetical protein
MKLALGRIQCLTDRAIRHSNTGNELDDESERSCYLLRAYLPSPNPKESPS